ncbi:hypothetical protein [Nonomuraea jabiensis]|uniref:hypothetical protein n=1 Tax=Nonomuraea jabiensis TaxID=882448 RepID=UPI003D7553DD
MGVRFDADGQHFSYTDAVGSTTALSVTCWAKIDADRDTYSTIWVIDNGTNADYVSLKTDINGTLIRALADSGSHAAREMVAGKWYFLGMSLGAGGGRLVVRAIDETSFSTQTWTTTSTVNYQALRVSKWINDTTSWFNGSVAGLKVWTAELTQAELEAEYPSMTAVRTAGLRGNWPFSDGTGRDVSGNNRNLTGGTGARWVVNPFGDGSPAPQPVTVTEDFEDTTYAFPITFGGWTRSNTDRHGGTWSMRSPTPTADSATYTATVTVPAGATSVRFWYRVSSELNYDFFRFYLGASGGAAIVEESGLGSWKQSAEISLNGATTVRFVYSKDPSGIGGSQDAVWVDDVVFTVPPPTRVRGWGPLPAF